MKLIKPKYEILQSQGLFKDIEIAARTCYKSEDKITDDSAEKMVKSLIDRKHTAMLEHGTVYLTIEDKSYLVLHIQKKYEDNKYSEVIRSSMNEFYGKCYITTNYRVLVENKWLDDLKYQCEPTEFHEKRISVRFTCDRGVSHEFVRHRVFSFAQESTRYCNYSKDKFENELTFIEPLWLNRNNLISKYNIDNKYAIYQEKPDSEFPNVIYEQEIEYIDEDTKIKTLWSAEDWYIYSLRLSELAYIKSLKQGWSPQQARAVLPNSLKTELVMTGFINDWKGFFTLRDATTAHPQAYELAHPLYEEFKQLELL